MTGVIVAPATEADDSVDAFFVGIAHDAGGTKFCYT